MELVDAFDNKHSQSREPPNKRVQAKPRIARPELHLRASGDDDIIPALFGRFRGDKDDRRGK